MFELCPKFIDGEPEIVRDDIHRIERGVRLTSLQPAPIRLLEAASLTKIDLAEPPTTTTTMGTPSVCVS